MPLTGVVIIGRNEGDRLRSALVSAAPHAAPARSVYVDSGSTDNSPDLARSMHFEVVRLDPSTPFTAARARNAGVRRLLELAPDTAYVQFIDGDCELAADWCPKALARLEEQTDLAVVCGRRRERFPDASPYNKLCDIEWNTPVGQTDACGGDAMMRLAAFNAVNGFNENLIAGEEPELCLRLRQAGWKIERLDAEMTLHDAAMTRLGQWWRREKRTGYAMAEAARLHGRKTPERFRVAKHRSNWFWAALLPLLAIAPARWTRGWTLLLLLAYPLQWLRIKSTARRQRNLTSKESRLYATYLLLGKFPQMLGQLQYWLGQLFHRPSRLIEYKDSNPPREMRDVGKP